MSTELIKAIREVLRISDRQHVAWDAAKAELAKLESALAEPVGLDESLLPSEERRALTGLHSAMAAKLYAKYVEGYDGFELCTADRLSAMLRAHVDKGDPVDVANFCAFLHFNGYGITPAPQPQQPQQPQQAGVAAAKLPNERAAFEREMAGLYFDRTDGGDYDHLATEGAWRGWQARAALAATPPQPTAPALTEEQIEAGAIALASSWHWEKLEEPYKVHYRARFKEALQAAWSAVPLLDTQAVEAARSPSSGATS